MRSTEHPSSFLGKWRWVHMLGSGVQEQIKELNEGGGMHRNLSLQILIPSTFTGGKEVVQEPS